MFCYSRIWAVWQSSYYRCLYNYLYSQHPDNICFAWNIFYKYVNHEYSGAQLTILIIYKKLCVFGFQELLNSTQLRNAQIELGRFITIFFTIYYYCERLAGNRTKINYIYSIYIHTVYIYIFARGIDYYSILGQ